MATIIRRKALFIAMAIPVLIAWVAAVGWGIHSLLAFSYTPGLSANLVDSAALPTEALPAGSSLLVMFVHPQCGCSRASIAELARIMANATAPVVARVYVYRAPGVDPGWERTDLWSSAAAIPGVEVSADDSGAIAARFGARVSGETQLYGQDGVRTFSGGITAARGHQGDNDGRRSVLASLAGTATGLRMTPVFGCYIHPSTEGTE